MPDRELLDDLTGHEFEELMVDVFRKMDYKDVHETRKTGDEGKDILMEDENGKVIVECKHTKKVSRPVVQKLHSAISTTPDAEKGMVVCTGRFTKPAKEYADKISSNGAEEIKLMNGDELRKIGDEIGLDLYSGKIEIICDKSLPYPERREKVTMNIYDELEEVNSFDKEYIEDIKSELGFSPSVKISYNLDAVFETSVGVVSTSRDTGSIFILSDDQQDFLLGDDKEKNS